MARRPVSDEHLLVPACSGERGERFYLAELAKYLGIIPRVLHKYARRHRILHYAPRGTGKPAVAYVTEQGALRLIAYARVRQGAWYVQGKDYHAIHAKLTVQMRAHKQRRRAAAEQERAAQAFRSGLLASAPVLNDGSTK